MHELGLAEGILAVALDAADGQRVRRVRLRVGQLHCVVPDSLQFGFQLLAQDTPAADALLELEEVPVRWQCQVCATENALATPSFICPHCGAAEPRILAGEELLVDAVQLDSGWRYRPGQQPSAQALAEVAREHLEDHRPR